MLRNADRYRPEGTPIAITLEAGEPGFVLLRIRNQGPHIDAAMLDQIFEYGVSDTAPQVNGERRGQGSSSQDLPGEDGWQHPGIQWRRKAWCSR